MQIAISQCGRHQSRQESLALIVGNFARGVREVRVEVDFPNLLPMPDTYEERLVTDMEIGGGGPRRDSAKKLEGDESQVKRATFGNFPHCMAGRSGSHTMLGITLSTRVLGRDWASVLITNTGLAKGRGF